MSLPKNEPVKQSRALYAVLYKSHASSTVKRQRFQFNHGTLTPNVQDAILSAAGYVKVTEATWELSDKQPETPKWKEYSNKLNKKNNG